MSSERRSEFDLINVIRGFEQELPDSIEESIGDDAAVFRAPGSGRFVITTDLLIEDVHFSRKWSAPFLLGRKSVRVNASDVAAMGATPYACLLSLGLPASQTGDFFDAFVEGFLLEASNQNMPVIGGDTSRSTQLVISVTALGTVSIGRPALRSGGQSGDLLYLIGAVGLSRVGLEYLTAHEPGWAARLRSFDELAPGELELAVRAPVEAQLLPEIFVQSAAWLQREKLATSMIDISDGLAGDLLHILTASGLAAEIWADHLPAIAGVTDPKRLLDLQLNGGEDYALLFSCPPDLSSVVETRYPPGTPKPLCIGRLVEGETRLTIVENQNRRSYLPTGFDHFK